MNCHHARQLISPYLDHQLTGQQMLALQQHFSVCEACDAEMRSLRRLKLLLRSMSEPRVRQDLPEAIAARLTAAEAPAPLWDILLPLSSLAPGFARPQRGRRLVTALALSCLTVLAAAAPFAPASQDRAMTSSVFFMPPGFMPHSLIHGPSAADPEAQSGNVLLTAMPAADVRPAEILILTDTEEARQERSFAAQYAQPPQPDGMATPLNDALPGYVQGDAAFTDYRTR